LSSSDRTAILRLYAARTTTRGAASIAVASPTFSVVGDQGNASSELSNVGDTTTSNQHQGLLPQLFNQLDVDQSNSLTADEVSESVWESFSALDGNADGGVTLKELKVDRAVLLDGLFAAFDENSDGVLSTDEIPESVADRLQDGDTDADGTISKEEFSDLNDQRTRCGNLGSLISGLLRRRTGRF
jgi:Ca2+-binding EF-hand superfamily protein